MKFSELNIDPLLKKGIESIGYETMTPIQEQSIQPILDGRDLMGPAKTGSGIEELKNLIIKTLAESASHSGDVFINTERQRQSVLNCRRALLRSIEPLKNNEPLFEITAHELRIAIDCLSSFLGETTTDEILDSVFSNFCVGK